MTYAECGKNRFQHRFAIRATLLEQGLSMADFAQRIGVSAEVVSGTILGKRHSQRVLDALMDMGISEEILFDPRKMSGAA